MRRLSVLFALLLVACGLPAGQTNRSQPTAELTVFAAASLTEAFGEIGRRFDAANATTTSFNVAGSHQLAQQIIQGAPADVFASANTRQMDEVIATGAIANDAAQTFVTNRLVVIYPADNPANLRTLADLAGPDVHIVLADAAVPVGQYSLEFLARASELPEYPATYSETVLANVVSYEENVRAVLAKVQLGEADAGIVYSSDISRVAAARVGRINIPDALNTIAAYPIAPLVDAPSGQLAQRFVEYVLSADGQRLLADYGFIPVIP
jgi:molybdate transport system substrate-binding protein